MVNSLWNETKASQLSQGVDELVYRSNLIELTVQYVIGAAETHR